MNIYSIKMKKSLFLEHSNNIVATSIVISNGQVSFKTDQITKKYLDDNNIPYLGTNNIKLKKKGAINIINLLMFFISFLGILYINTFRVSAVVFNESFLINDTVLASIEARYKHLLFFNFIDEDFDALSKKIRSEHSEYEWIEVSKTGSKIYVTISNTHTSVIKDDHISGDIIATKSGIIDSFRVYGGLGEIERNQYVNEGDILIAGNDTRARGLILANTFEEYTTTIKKKDITTKETQSITSFKQFYLFGKKFSFKKSNYIKSVKNQRLIFNFFDFFKIYQIEDKELCDIINVYDYDLAYKKAIEQYELNFSKNCSVSEEKILKIALLYHTENTDSFEFRFLVKKLESIGAFQEKISWGDFFD